MCSNGISGWFLWSYALVTQDALLRITPVSPLHVARRHATAKRITVKDFADVL